VIYAVPQNKARAQHFGSSPALASDGSLLGRSADGAIRPLQLEGALIRRQAQNRSSALGKAVAHHRDGAPPWAILCTAGRSAIRLDYGHSAMCRVWLDPAQRAGPWVANNGARAAMSSTWGGRRELRLACVTPISREYFRSAISAAQSAQAGGSTAGMTPRLPLPVGDSTVAIGTRPEWQSVRRWGWSSRDGARK